MIRKIWNQLAAKCVNRETVSYFIFGVLTTAVDWVGYFALYNMSWAAAVLFAFITNKLFVFQSTSLKLSRLFSELVSFVACRLFTGILTIAGMELMVNGLGWSNLFGKIAVSVLSLVLNYILSKLFIFRGREAVSEKQGK